MNLKKEGNAIQLPVGKYEIKETIAPNGYLFNEEVGELEIKENGEIVEAELKNKKIPKVDSATASLDKPLTSDDNILMISGIVILASILSIILLNRKNNEFKMK